MAGYAKQARRSARLLAETPNWQRLLQLRPELDDETAAAVLEAAGALAEGVVAPLNPAADHVGCRLVEGRVLTPAGFAAAFRQYADGGWIAMDLPERLGGQDLPTALHTACQLLFDRACPALMMAPGASRAATHLLATVAEPAVAETWIPKLAAGDWTATICISEPDAGSDVGRIRTRAERIDGRWRVTGEKCWISFGGHDMTGRIGHCLLARTAPTPGTRGLSLFLVPDRDEGGAPNGVSVTRIEEKLGLHGSPTCALAFDGADAVLLGAEGRGLTQLFAMIQPMRLLVAGQGLAIALGAAEVARGYAGERRQGGAADAPPPPILAHPDVRRQLMAMAATTEILHGALLEAATSFDLARLEPDPAAQEAHAAFVAWMLPMLKTFGAEAGFDVASAAIQVIGGAGYTRDWPVEQALRDARALAIYEGTSGMQALDFLTRRLWADQGRGLAVFLDRARAEIAGAPTPSAAQAGAILDRFEALATEVNALQASPARGHYAADAFLRAGWIAVSAWMAHRLARGSETGARAASAFRLVGLAEELALMSARCQLTPAVVARHFDSSTRTAGDRV